jgi:hypothetical protein
MYSALVRVVWPGIRIPPSLIPAKGRDGEADYSTQCVSRDQARVGAWSSGDDRSQHVGGLVIFISWRCRRF